ncbi:MAG: LuxR C-terminal-related transcriptional regulator, partial [Terriglobia bacterium]
NNQPDVILLSADLRDGARSGFEAMRQLQRTDRKARVIMLLDKVERESVVAAFRGGAKGVYARSDSLPGLWKCIRAVHEGQIWATSGQLQFLLEELVRTRPARVWNRQGKELLTPREGQVVRLVAEGLTNREISREIGVSEHTVKNCVFRVYNKLGVSTRVELALYALGQDRGDFAAVPKIA